MQGSKPCALTNLAISLNLVEREGFEPSTNGLKVHCATGLRQRSKTLFDKQTFEMVADVGFDPTTPRL